MKMQNIKNGFYMGLGIALSFYAVQGVLFFFKIVLSLLLSGLGGDSGGGIGA